MAAGGAARRLLLLLAARGLRGPRAGPGSGAGRVAVPRVGHSAGPGAGRAVVLRAAPWAAAAALAAPLVPAPLVPAPRRAERRAAAGRRGLRAAARLARLARLALRACALLLRFAPPLLLYALSRVWPRVGALWPRRLRAAAEAAGPACVKLGQWASTRRDLFSEALCAELAGLRAAVRPHPWRHTERLLAEAFGERWGALLHFPSREPVGSGCVAQVYRAYADLAALAGARAQGLAPRSLLAAALEVWRVTGLGGLLRWLGKTLEEKSREELSLKGWYPGEQMDRLLPSTSPPSARHLTPVAVKVLHPELVDQVQMDLFLMKIGSHILGLLPGFKWLSLPEIVEEFEKLMIQQIDLRYEARNLERFRQNFLDVDFVKFPTPLHPLVTADVLVETFEESEPISQYLHAEIAPELRQRLARMGMDMLLKMVFVDNFVHADLHPGNILVQGTAHCSAGGGEQLALVDLCDTLVLEVQPPRLCLRLVLLDAGIVAELQPADMRNFRAVFTAVVQGQGERVAELILHHARAKQCQDVERFKAEMAELVARARGSSLALGKLQVAHLLSNVFKLLMTHKVKLESNFASIVFAIMVLEGLGRSLDPELDILQAAKPLLIKTAASGL